MTVLITVLPREPGRLVKLYRILGGIYDVENYLLIGAENCNSYGVAVFGSVEPDGLYVAGTLNTATTKEAFTSFTVYMGNANATINLPVEKPSRTVAARVPMFGNSAYVQKYLRKLRDRIFGKWHRRLHPVI